MGHCSVCSQSSCWFSIATFWGFLLDLLKRSDTTVEKWALNSWPKVYPKAFWTSVSRVVNDTDVGKTQVVDWISAGWESRSHCWDRAVITPPPKLILSEITLFDQYCTLVFRSFHLFTSDQFSPVQRSSQSLDKYFQLEAKVDQTLPRKFDFSGFHSSGTSKLPRGEKRAIMSMSGLTYAHFVQSLWIRVQTTDKSSLFSFQTHFWAGAAEMENRHLRSHIVELYVSKTAHPPTRLPRLAVAWPLDGCVYIKWTPICSGFHINLTSLFTERCCLFLCQPDQFASLGEFILTVFIWPVMLKLVFALDLFSHVYVGFLSSIPHSYIVAQLCL